VLARDDPFLTSSDADGSGDKYEDFPEDDDRDVHNPQVALDIAKDIREIGSKLFKSGNSSSALDKYQKAVRYLDISPLSTLDSPIKAEYEALLAPLLLNTALCALRAPADYRLAYNSATRALEKLPLSDADKGKAYYRRGLANAGLGEDDDAEHDLAKASQLVKGDKAILDELEKVRARRRAKKEKAKAGLRKLFA